jgi:hypothetical protein
MNKIRFISLVVISAVIFSCCQRVINIDLNTANAKVVIEAFVTDQPGIDTIKLSLTGSYFNPGNYPAINNAVVVISDNAGVTDTLQQIDNGRYTAAGLTGVPGRTYTLKVFTGGKEYDAVSTMPYPVSPDTVVAVFDKVATINGVADSTFRIRCFFQDPPGFGNFYRAQLVVNGKLYDSLGNVTLYQDKFIDGAIVNLRLRGYSPKLGDSARVDLMCIDGDTYKFFSVVRSISGNGNPISTATPQNPPTNIIGGAVGYFAAYPIRSKTILVQ